MNPVPAPAPATEVGSGHYLPGLSVEEYLARLAGDHPRLHALIDPGRATSARTQSALATASNEFDSDATGRGDSYRRAQRDVLVRWTGAAELLRLAAGTAPRATLLDVLGGDGTLARAGALRDPGGTTVPWIVTGDVSAPMVAAALAHGLPAVRQSAEQLLLRDASVDATLLAYGTHHIPEAGRVAAVREAVRVTRVGGRVVVHDFEQTSPMARFFAEVVDPCSAAGHTYPHFTRAGMADLFAGLPVRVRIREVYDPLVVSAPDADRARARMCDYVADMYGVPRLRQVDAGWPVLLDVFDHAPRGGASGPRRPAVRPGGTAWIAEVPRTAIVAVAERTHG